MRLNDHLGMGFDMSDFNSLPHEKQLEQLQLLANEALGCYSFSSATEASLINLSENATYRVTDPETNEQWALRIHREGYHTKNAIESELTWASALKASGTIVTPAPIPGKNGQIIQTVSHADVSTSRYVVLFEWESGEEPDESSQDLRQPFEVLGEIAAKMHQQTQAWNRPDNFERLTWDFDTSLGSSPHWGRWREGMGMTDEIESVFADTVALIGKRLARFGKGSDRFGLIHCDMRLANLLIDGDVTKVIDFDDCGFSWFMYDCATTVSFFEHKPEVPSLLSSWVRGYRKIVDLSDEDEAEIPTFVMLRRLLLVAWFGSHSGIDLAQSMGEEYTRDTVPLCKAYMSEYG